ncbi:MAG: excinuclease ABC subunit C, partial [Microthrixaceae bacterium]|nr:excinuclease ABC subunit C [Microthrixaceae bacterium]
ESHRFAISYHRQLRGKRMLLSELDDVTGLGPRRRERLIEHFGSVPKLRSAALEDLLALSWLPSDVAEAV